MRNYTLCLIDMQDYFVKEVLPLNENLVENVTREIKQAVQDNAGILSVEYFGYGPLLPQLLQVGQSGRFHQITKPFDCGSPEVIEALFKYRLPHSHLKVCGVNTDCCVYRTMRGVWQDLPHCKLEIIADACGSQWGQSDHESGLENFRRMGCKISNVS